MSKLLKNNTAAHETYESSYSRLKALGNDYGFVPSQNPFDQNGASVTQFVNKRLYEGNQASADLEVDNVLTALREAKFEVVEVKRETVVFDTNQQLDKWWI